MRSRIASHQKAHDLLKQSRKEKTVSAWERFFVIAIAIHTIRRPLLWCLGARAHVGWGWRVKDSMVTLHCRGSCQWHSNKLFVGIPVRQPKIYNWAVIFTSHWNDSGTFCGWDEFSVSEKAGDQIVLFSPEQVQLELQPDKLPTGTAPPKWLNPDPEGPPLRDRREDQSPQSSQPWIILLPLLTGKVL